MTHLIYRNANAHASWELRISISFIDQETVFAATFMDLNHISISAVLQEWDLMILPVFMKFLR